MSPCRIFQRNTLIVNRPIRAVMDDWHGGTMFTIILIK